MIQRMRKRNIVICFLAILIPLALYGYISIAKWHEAKEEEEKCLYYLRCIEGSKNDWAVFNHRRSNDTPIWDDLRPYLENVIWGCAGASNGEKLPHCPGGGIYTLGRVDELPRCSIPRHALPPWPDTTIVVEDIGSNGILDAKIEVYDSRENVFEATTDSHGIAKFHPWPRGSVAIRVSKKGYLTEMKELQRNQPPGGPVLLNFLKDQISTNKS